MASFASFRAAPSFAASNGLLGGGAAKNQGFFAWNSSSQSAASEAGVKGNLLRSLFLPSIKDASPLSIAATVLVVILTLLACEQIIYRRRKAHLPGPSWTVPVLGKFLDSMNPSMSNYMKGWNSGPLSVASVFHIFIVVASSVDHTRKILQSSQYAEPCLVNAAKTIICPDNWVFLNGKPHIDYRKGLNTLFTARALSIYLGIQQEIYNRHFAAWMADKDPNPKPYQMLLRDLNMETSLRVFCGDYITDADAQLVSDKYWAITMALELVNFPIPLPGTKIYRAIQARKMVMKLFMSAAAQSKVRMAEGGEVKCLTDAWIKAMLDARMERENPELGSEARRILVRDFSDREIALVVLSFLFASQDAMSSALVYLFQHVADRPEIMRKIREEQYRLRGHNLDEPLTIELIESMEYTRAVVKESLRLRPPVLMVPYKTLKPFPIDDNYTVPKGAMVIPSFWNSLHDPQAYPEPDAMKPERWLEGKDRPAQTHTRNWLVFGSGPHYCIGQQYAQMHLTAVLSAASTKMNWDHEITPLSEQIEILCCIFPKDQARLKFYPRAQPAVGVSPEEAAAADL
jgi:C-22 sterol desaturase